MRFLNWLLAGLLAFLVWSSLMLARAAELHNANDPSHWYDAACCNLRDCRPISGIDKKGVPWSEVVQTDNGYKWTSSKSGKVHLIPPGHSKLKPSQDGFYHGCETPSAGIFLCLYEPLFF